jgi:hypothetical protein
MPGQLQSLTSRRWFAPAAVAAGIALLGLYDVELITDGTLRLGQTEKQCGAYPAMWTSLTQGRFDIPHDEIRYEAYIRDGKTYTYFGIFPALLRGPLQNLVQLEGGCLARPSIVVAALISVFSFIVAGLALRFRTTAARARFALFVLTLALGSPVMYSLSFAQIYQEATHWGCAWASVFLACFVVHVLGDPRYRSRTLIGMALAAGLTLLSRASVGFAVCSMFAAVLAYRVWDLRGGFLNRRPLLAAGFIFGVLLAGQAVVNYGRWGNVFEFAPMRLHEGLLNSARGRAFAAAGSFRLDRIPAALAYYFLPAWDNFTSQPPFLVFSTVFPFRSFARHFDYIEYSRMPLPLSVPGLLAFAGLGVVSTWKLPADTRRWLLVLAGGSAITLGILATVWSLALRYTLDMEPFLGAWAVVGLVALDRNEPQVETAATARGTVILGALVVWSLVACQATLYASKIGAGRAIIPMVDESLLLPRRSDMPEAWADSLPWWSCSSVAPQSPPM